MEMNLYEEFNLIKLLPKNDIKITEFTSSEKWITFFRSYTAQIKILNKLFSVPCGNAFLNAFLATQILCGWTNAIV